MDVVIHTLPHFLTDITVRGIKTEEKSRLLDSIIEPSVEDGPWL